jgi:heterotetrameric sarcosine oxidase gamma subunit
MIANNSAPIATTSSYNDLLVGGAVMGTEAGWQVPVRFSGLEPELQAAHERVGMAEQGHVTKLRMQGPGVPAALEKMQKLGTVPVIGRVGDATVRVKRSGVEVEVARLAETEAWITAPPGGGLALTDAVEALADSMATFDLTSSLSAVRLVGPNAEMVVASLTDLDLRPTAMPDRSCAQTNLAEVYGLIVRADIGDLPSYRLFFGREYGIYLWESLMEAGEAFGMELIGSQALATLEAKPE